MQESLAQCSPTHLRLSYLPDPPSTPRAAPPPSAPRRLSPQLPAEHSQSAAHTSPAHSPASRPVAKAHPPAAPVTRENCWLARAVAAAAAQCARRHPPSPALESECRSPPLPGSATPAPAAHTARRTAATP